MLPKRRDCQYLEANLGKHDATLEESKGAFTPIANVEREKNVSQIKHIRNDASEFITCLMRKKNKRMQKQQNEDYLYEEVYLKYFNDSLLLTRKRCKLDEARHQITLNLKLY